MLRHARALWRTLRDVPGIRAAIEAADRAWWAHTIRRADVVDLDFVRAQGHATGIRQAVRSYVRGGFRRDEALNPLFMEQLVSGQLSDAGRVPALYAYLVNDPRSIRTSVAWDSVAYAAAEPASLDAPGGPLGHAWRSARHSDRVLLGAGSARRAASWSEAINAACDAARWSSVPGDAPTPSALHRPLVFVCRIAAHERSAAAALDAAAEVARNNEADVVVALEGGQADAWAAAALMALSQPHVQVAADIDTVAAVEAATAASVLLVRGPRAQISADDLMAVAQAATESPAQPLWLGEEGSVAAAGAIVRDGRRFHFLAGHPAEDAALLGAEVIVAEVAGNTYARPLIGRDGAAARVLLTATVRAPAAGPDPAHVGLPDSPTAALVEPMGLAIAQWTADGPTYIRAPETVALDDGTLVPRLRWAIKTAAPAGPAGEAWGDTHFARGIAAALRRLGQEVVIDSYAARRRPSRYLDDVVVALRGPEPIEPQAGATSLMWIISHPDQIGAAEIGGFDVVFAGSRSWAVSASERLGRHIEPLLQCTDARRFRPQGLARTEDLVFVGTARGIPRPSIIEPLRAGIPVSVYGPDWRGWIPASAIVAAGVPNTELPALYESAGAVLNDHWPAMQTNGFISNRLYDVVAAGGRVISDAVTGIGDIFSGAVHTYGSVPELLALLRQDLDDIFPDEDELATISARVRREHSFDARARTLLDAALNPAAVDVRTSRSPG